MSNLKEVWEIWRGAGGLDRDIAKAFERAITAEKVHALLLELEQAEQELAQAIEIIEGCGVDSDEIKAAWEANDE